jgi:hypothetical protein
MNCQIHILNDADGNPINRNPIILNAFVTTEGDFAQIDGSTDWSHHKLEDHQLRLYLPHIEIHISGIQIVGFGGRKYNQRIEWQLYPELFSNGPVVPSQS